MINGPVITAVDLFCGVGGLTHGLERSGVHVAAGFDVDPSCKYPYETNNAARFYERDVGQMPADEIGARLSGVDIRLLAGCAPCQPFSTYGRGANRRSQGDWRLLSTFGKVVEQVQPELVTMENVPQIAQHDVFRDFLERLNGYKIWWNLVECAAFGVPQTRKRLVLLASRLGDRDLVVRPTSAAPSSVRETIGLLPALAAGETDPGDRMHTASRLSPDNMRRIRASVPGGTWRDWPAPLRAACHRKPGGATYPSVYGRMVWDAPAPTITTQCFGYGNGRFGHPVQDRAISLREAAMLQTFPPKYDFAPVSETIRFNKMGRLIGNAVPVRLGEAIGHALNKHVASTIGA